VLVSQAGPVLEVGREPGRQLVALGLAVALSAVAFDRLAVGRLSMFYDLVFITLCLCLALLVRPQDFFMTACLPPVITLVVFALLAGVAPAMVADAGDSFVQALVTGLVQHSFAFLVGFVLCLATLGVRMREQTQT
jgi:ABC-type transport system involved in cytochrome c biogenesis permease subunit